MRDRVGRDYLIIFMTFLLGMILTLLPLPTWATNARPHWVLLITIFWLLIAPHRVGMGFAWCMGLFMDLLTGTLFGQQALLFCITAYIVLKFQNWLVHMPMLQQTLAVFILVVLNLVVNRCLIAVLLHSPLHWSFWMSAVTTAIIWPWLFGLLSICQIKLRVVDFT